jgi:glutathione S-transferase
MKLYYNPMSPNCRKVTALAHHINAPLELQIVDVMAGGADTPDYLKMNPNGMVPTLEDGALHLWESNAIMQYIADKTHATEVWPTDWKARADISRWQCWQLAHWGRACDLLLWENMFKKFMGQGEADASAVEEALSTFRGHATVLDHHLKGKHFIAGNHPTLADFSIASGLTFAGPAKIPYDRYTHLHAWYERIEKLDAWKKTAPKSGSVN